MRALKGAAPRGLRDHRTRAGVEYLRFVGAKLERLGGVVPRDARVWLREAGLLVPGSPAAGSSSHVLHSSAGYKSARRG